ncbi:MAG TPA: MarR family transcriptional regulator [Rhizomicrobium sp.]|nr:MarR family transcriptional regulator [Rhizomicrobium sp.]
MGFSKKRYTGLAGFRHALRQFLASSEDICRQAGITTTQYQAILALGSSDQSVSMKQLAEQLLLKHHSAVQLVDRLSEAGLVERAAAKNDARMVLVVLTAKGESVLDALAKLHLAEMLKHEPQLTRSLRSLRKQGD